MVGCTCLALRRSCRCRRGGQREKPLACTVSLPLYGEGSHAKQANQSKEERALASRCASLTFTNASDRRFCAPAVILSRIWSSSVSSSMSTELFCLRQLRPSPTDSTSNLPCFGCIERYHACSTQTTATLQDTDISTRATKRHLMLLCFATMSSKIMIWL